MRIIASVISHPGKCREKNEDNFCLNGKKLSKNSTLIPIKYTGKTSSPILMGVFDGMGGIKAGELASLITAEIVCDALDDTNHIADFEDFQINLCKQANDKLCYEMINTVKQRMGTTASMLCFYKEHYHLCNIGDSPIYLFRNNRLTPIFHEHTEKENLLKIHGINKVFPKKKFKLTQHIGIFPEELEIEPFVFSEQIQSNDQFIIASDGLTDMVNEQKITEILNKRMSPSRTVKHLLRLALDQGGKDNITIICIDTK